MAAAGAEPGDLGRLLPEARAREREAEAALETLLGRRVRPPPPPRNPPPRTYALLCLSPPFPGGARGLDGRGPAELPGAKFPACLSPRGGGRRRQWGVV